METFVRWEPHRWDEKQRASFEVCGSLNADIIIESTTQSSDWFGVGSILFSMTKVCVVVAPTRWKALLSVYPEKDKGSRYDVSNVSNAPVLQNRCIHTGNDIDRTYLIITVGLHIFKFAKKNWTKCQDLQIPKERRNFGDQKCGVPVSVDCGCDGPVFKQVDCNHLAAKVQILASWFQVAKAWCGSGEVKGDGIWVAGYRWSATCSVYFCWLRVCCLI